MDQSGELSVGISENGPKLASKTGSNVVTAEDAVSEQKGFPVVKIEQFAEFADQTPLKGRRRPIKTPHRSGTPSQPGSGPGTATTTTRRRRSSSRSSSKNLKSSTEISPASMIFRNLLILEDDLRRQARQQKALKWQFTLFLALLLGLAAAAFYELFFSQEPVRGLYKVALQFALIFILVTVVLFHLSGEYRRTIVIPRKFFASTNKGIRQFNVKLVKVRSSLADLSIDLVRWLCRTAASVNLAMARKFLPARMAEKSGTIRFWDAVALRSQPRIGAIDVKLVLNPRAFSAEVREGWEIYRDEFWAREGARRRKQVNETGS
ncbi:LAME_0A06084g1_1 [Lachancea meyersii CBS 8951]|uniref:LAME_0A06084g1_1 n=1 Tax=Lachancea meyersii CBS 8951 TaxID=1266667 RepID=A0A1G4IQ21_9SACH|nr:LAME_0A06084g1_1 [Lachancea meyersii CBS 8951]